MRARSNAWTRLSGGRFVALGPKSPEDASRFQASLTPRWHGGDRRDGGRSRPNHPTPHPAGRRRSVSTDDRRPVCFSPPLPHKTLDPSQPTASDHRKHPSHRALTALLPPTRMRPKSLSEGLARRAGRGRMPCDRELRGRDPESRRILCTVLEGLRIRRRAGSDRWCRSRGPSRGRRRGCGPRLTCCQAQSSSMISSESSMTTGIKGSKSSCLPALEGGAMMSCWDEETTISRGEGSGKPWFKAVLAAAGGD